MKLIRNTKIKVTEENVSKLKGNEIFVFGSNLAGIHGGGAALLAKNKFGAVLGVSEGITGQTYALPTKDKNIETLSLNDIHKSVEILLEEIKKSSKFFIITAVGCGLAGYKEKDIAPMFEPFINLSNISLPQAFIDVIFPPKIIGYKVTDSNMKCRHFQFTMNKTYSHKGDVVVCNTGFHFCKDLKDCFNYYSFNPENKVFLVEGSGNYDFNEDKISVEHIKFIEEVTWHQVLDKVNTGKGNSGLSNSGDYNSGDYNSGDYNSGDYNSGDYNSGYYNSDEPNARIFNIDSGKKYSEINMPWLDMETTKWVSESNMTEQEKQDNPKFYVTQGHLKEVPYKEAFKKAWDKNREFREATFTLPNFDKKVFEEITGIQV